MTSRAEATRTPVGVMIARIGTVTREVPVTGSMASLQDVTVSARLTGRVEAVPVREGDAVTSGHVLVQFDTNDLRSQVRSAEAAVAVASAKLAQAEAAYQQQVVMTRAGIESAESILRAVRAGLSQVRAGARRQEIAQQEAQVAIAREQYEKARSDLVRYQQLFAQHLIAAIEVDQYRAATNVAREQLRAAEQRLSLLKEGARTQEVAQAEESVQQAEESLRQAAAARALDRVRQAEVQAATAEVQRQQNALAIARHAIADAAVRAPFSGLVVERRAEPGQVVGSSQPAIRGRRQGRTNDPGSPRPASRSGAASSA